MKQLTQILRNATRAIEAGYFHLNIDGGDPIYRERVYCYELYHQMRCLWPPKAECPFYLSGEIDKAAHPILTELGAAGAKPDLLVHRPGYMDGNHAVIEVKHCDCRREGIEKDLSTLTIFINRVRYRRAIYLIYGDQADDRLEKRIAEIARSISNLAPIELWIHAELSGPARHAATLTAS
jgi:hypothetical protein